MVSVSLIAAGCLLVVALQQSVEAATCGKTLTKECLAKYDRRYNADISPSFESQGKAWNKFGGLYKGEFFTYDPQTFERMTVTEFVNEFTGRNRYLLSPSLMYLNWTIFGTRSYRHSYTYEYGRFGGPNPFFGARPGRFVYCDSWSMATWEKDAIAKNFKTICTGKDVETALSPQSAAYPIGDHGLVFQEFYRPNDDSKLSIIQESYSFACTTVNCTNVTYSHERFQDGERILFELGDIHHITEDEFLEETKQAFSEYLITERDQLDLPMQGACLNSGKCMTEKDFCNAGDPQCSNSPYTEPDGEVKPGAIVAFVIAGLIFVAAICLILWILFTRAQVERYREFFAMRMVDIMATLDKPLMEFSPEEMVTEYKILEEKARGELNHDNMYEFLSTGPAGYMDYWDFSALWESMDRKKSGRVDFLEFCSVMAHAHEELEQAKYVARTSGEAARDENRNLFM